MTQALPGLNNVYNQLHDVLTAGLRRQILLGVCASVQEESQLHQQLQADVVQRGSQILTIQWQPEQPQLLKAIAELLVQYPAAFQGTVPPTLVISNIASLTQSPATCQQRFLRQLRSLADHIADWNFNLLLWVNAPWLHQLQQAAPEFWRWHTGVFWLTPTQLNPEVPEPAATTQARITLQGHWEHDLERDSPTVTAPPNLQQALQQYRERLAQGDTSLTTLNQAIQTAEALIEQTQDTTAEQQNDLGNFYWLRSRSRQQSTQPEQRQKTTQDLLRALHYYEQALTQIGDPQSAPQTYAMIQNNLGAAYGDLAHHDDPVANLQRAIQAYETSLQYRTPAAEPAKYSATQNNRGTAYWHLSKHQDTEINLEGAIAAYLAACAVYEQRGDWSNWAMLQNNLGTTYWQLAQQTHEVGHLTDAIACYQQSLRYRTAENAPAAYAATQNNIAAAQWHLASLPDQPIAQVQGYFDAAIAAYTEAAQVARQLSLQDPPVFVNFDFLAAYHNLGVVHYQLATETRFDLPLAEQQAHLHTSVQTYCRALQLLATDSESFTSTLMGLVQSIRACYERGGISGQNEALQQVPGVLLPHLLPQLST